ncbi:MAG: hypothetical protein EPO19_16120 [Betaproteobacteria bacterium]|nr:MAG: hypothetical protein EPO19_16120 [Betaproteobacteria bacterium]
MNAAAYLLATGRAGANWEELQAVISLCFFSAVFRQGFAADGAKRAGEQFGGYAQSSGSGNANIAVWRH